MSKRQIFGGGLQTAAGAPLALGYLKMRLNTDATTIIDQVCAGRVLTIPLDASGNILGTIEVWPNDQLSPSGTVYVTTAYDQRGQSCWSSDLSIPSGSTPYSLG